jgi:hypothetical protein
MIFWSRDLTESGWKNIAKNSANVNSANKIHENESRQKTA